MLWRTREERDFVVATSAVGSIVLATFLFLGWAAVQVRSLSRSLAGHPIQIIFSDQADYMAALDQTSGNVWVHQVVKSKEVILSPQGGREGLGTAHAAALKSLKMLEPERQSDGHLLARWRLLYIDTEGVQRKWEAVANPVDQHERK